MDLTFIILLFCVVGTGARDETVAGGLLARPSASRRPPPRACRRQPASQPASPTNPSRLTCVLDKLGKSICGSASRTSPQLPAK